MSWFKKQDKVKTTFCALLFETGLLPLDLTR